MTQNSEVKQREFNLDEQNDDLKLKKLRILRLWGVVDPNQRELSQESHHFLDDCES